jgi:hypothetical protein
MKTVASSAHDLDETMVAPINFAAPSYQLSRPRGYAKSADRQAILLK